MALLADLVFPLPATSCGNITSLCSPSISTSLSDKSPLLHPNHKRGSMNCIDVFQRRNPPPLRRQATVTTVHFCTFSRTNPPGGIRCKCTHLDIKSDSVLVLERSETYLNKNSLISLNLDRSGTRAFTNFLTPLLIPTGTALMLLQQNDFHTDKLFWEAKPVSHHNKSQSGNHFRR